MSEWAPMSGPRVLIVNLTRFGDLIQTSPTIAGLHARYPGAEVTVVAERNFAEVCEGIPGIDVLYPVDLDHLGRLLIEGGRRLVEAYRFVERLLADLRGHRYSLAFNFSSSRMSAVLLRLIGVPDTRGWTMTDDGFRQIAHPWSRLFSASCLNRRYAAFNLVDYYRRVADIRGGPARLEYRVSEAARARARAYLAAAGYRPGRPLVAIQLGASRSVRRWPTERCVQLARLLRERLGAAVLLTGAQTERPVAAEVVAAVGEGVIDACGRTSVAELGGLLEAADCLVTGDTGPMHMAVAVGTPVVALFFGPALPVDTGPYGVGHIALHAEAPCAPCDHSVACLSPFCRDLVSAEMVYTAIAARRAGDWDGLAAAADRWAGVRAYRTGFDAHGLFRATPLGKKPLRPEESLREAYRVLWVSLLDGEEAEPLIPLGGDAATFRRLAREAAAGEGMAARLEGAAAALGPRPGQAGVGALEALACKLEEQDRRMLGLGTVHAELAVLTQLFRFEKENLEGTDVARLAAATRNLYSALRLQATMMASLLEGPELPGALGKEVGNAGLD